MQLYRTTHGIVAERDGKLFEEDLPGRPRQVNGACTRNAISA